MKTIAAHFGLTFNRSNKDSLLDAVQADSSTVIALVSALKATIKKNPPTDDDTLWLKSTQKTLIPALLYALKKNATHDGHLIVMWLFSYACRYQADDLLLNKTVIFDNIKPNELFDEIYTDKHCDPVASVYRGLSKRLEEKPTNEQIKASPLLDVLEELASRGWYQVMEQNNHQDKRFQKQMQPRIGQRDWRQLNEIMSNPHWRGIKHYNQEKAKAQLEALKSLLHYYLPSVIVTIILGTQIDDEKVKKHSHGSPGAAQKSFFAEIVPTASPKKPAVLGYLEINEHDSKMVFR